jgi:tRNA (cytidine/uridine-2'-O-)-methyltransferase
MFHIVLFEPEIPPNTGNIIRLCANTGSSLHLIQPLGFTLEDKQLRRAGLDYHEWVTVQQYDNFPDFLEKQQPQRLFACSTKGKTRYDQVNFIPGDTFLFGPETRGLPAEILNSFAHDKILRIPMLANNRSLNLSNAAAIILYEAWRQIDFI